MLTVFVQTTASADDGDDDVIQGTPKKKTKTVAPEETSQPVQEEKKGTTCGTALFSLQLPLTLHTLADDTLGVDSVLGGLESVHENDALNGTNKSEYVREEIDVGELRKTGGTYFAIFHASLQ